MFFGAIAQKLVFATSVQPEHGQMALFSSFVVKERHISKTMI